MRLLLTLEQISDGQYTLGHNYYIQSLIYNILRESKFKRLHDKQGYKFFSFSNIFSTCDNDKKHILIASPNKEFINELNIGLKRSLDKRFSIGDLRFILKDIKIIRPKVRIPIVLTTSTPIVIRIPKDKYKMYGIRPRYEYDYLYWRKEYPLELFIEQLISNAEKKYKEYTSGISSKNDPNKESKIDKDSKRYIINIKTLRFRKQISTKVVIHGKEHIIIGTLWDFIIDDTQLNILRFIIECGLGERNSLGFGFINIR
jgi:CRISPR-associated endoribonuclease Cas6